MCSATNCQELYKAVFLRGSSRRRRIVQQYWSYSLPSFHPVSCKVSSRTPPPPFLPVLPPPLFSSAFHIPKLTARCHALGNWRVMSCDPKSSYRSRNKVVWLTLIGLRTRKRGTYSFCLNYYYYYYYLLLLFSLVLTTPPTHFLLPLFCLSQHELPPPPPPTNTNAQPLEVTHKRKMKLVNFEKEIKHYSSRMRMESEAEKILLFASVPKKKKKKGVQIQLPETERKRGGEGNDSM